MLLTKLKITIFEHCSACGNLIKTRRVSMEREEFERLMQDDPRNNYEVVKYKTNGESFRDAGYCNDCSGIT